MTLDETLLTSLSDWQPTGDGPHAYSDNTAGGWTVGLSADKADTVGCALTELSVNRPSMPTTAAELTNWAVRCADRVTGLLEPLKLIEVDAGRSEAILRSDAPAVRGDDLRYYELHLRGKHQATLRRYQASRTGSGARKAVPFALTHEAIAKVVADVTAS